MKKRSRCRLPPLSVLLPSAEVSIGHPHPKTPMRATYSSFIAKILLCDTIVLRRWISVNYAIFNSGHGGKMRAGADNT